MEPLRLFHPTTLDALASVGRPACLSRGRWNRFACSTLPATGFHDCTEGHVLKCAPEEIARVPAHKSLLRCDPVKGVPIGNLNSQFFANVYLNGLDQFVKHQLHCRHYVRYCDDFVLLSPDRDELLDWRRQIERHLDAELSLELNPRERLRPVCDGIDFLGYIVRRDYRLVRRRVVNACRERLRNYRALLVSDNEGTKTYRFDTADLERLHATLSSYLGHFRRANAHKLWQSLWHGHGWLAVYFHWDAAGGKVVPRYAIPKALNCVRHQYAWVRGAYPGDAVLFQVGAYFELYDPRDAPLAVQLGLKPLKENRRRALYGMPERLFGRYLARLLALGELSQLPDPQAVAHPEGTRDIRLLGIAVDAELRGDLTHASTSKPTAEGPARAVNCRF